MEHDNEQAERERFEAAFAYGKTMQRWPDGTEWKGRYIISEHEKCWQMWLAAKADTASQAEAVAAGGEPVAEVTNIGMLRATPHGTKVLKAGDWLYTRPSATEEAKPAAGWTMIAPDGKMFTGDRPAALILEANRHLRAIDPVAAEWQAENLRNAIAEELREHERDRAELVNRFLGWKLPATFSPDCGISFKRAYNESSPFGPQNHEPVGTNLFSGEEARAMLDYILDCDAGDRELGRRDTLINGMTASETAATPSCAGLGKPEQTR